MREIYVRQLEQVQKHGSHAEKLSYSSSIMRSLLQVMTVTALEIAFRATPARDDDLNIRALLDRFAQPSDGLPIEALDRLIPIIRSQVSRKYMIGWFERTPNSDQPLVAAMSEWVEFRNRKPGHGVVDAKDTVIWAERICKLIETILSDFPETLPHIETDGSLMAKIGDQSVKIMTPLVINGHAIVIGKVLSRKGVWKIQGQLLSWTDAREITIDLDPSNIFSAGDGVVEKFRMSEVAVEGGTRLIFNNIPVRQTTTFVGRKKELDKLSEWLDDVVDSRTCLIYGDGGFGKTTLALEFFNNLLDGNLEQSRSLPSIISFYTAKKTKWTEEGLVHFKGITSAMEDSVRELLYFFYPVLGKEWYKIDGNALIDKVAGEFSAQAFSRNDILLIIDNTETLATSPVDAQELGDFITRVAKKLGRVVITSRRREMLAATPLPVSSLSEMEAFQLIERLGNEYGATAITQAGEPKLRSACRQLMYKPLLIDTLVRYVARSSSGIQEGLDQILKKTNDQLLEFLYEDAWARMTMLVREVFIVLVSLASPLNGKCVGDVCTEVGVLHAEFQASLGETYFASLIDHGDTYDLDIVDLAKEFFRQEKRRCPKEEIDRLEKIALKVDKLATERYEIEKNYRLDRVADGFRSEFAKAAKIATIKRQYDVARDNFELALLDEPLNASLRERYASFLLRNMDRADEAISHAEKATKLDPHSGDAWLTLGLIRYKLGQLVEGDEAMDKALSFGKPESLCLLRKAIARYYYARREPYGKAALKYLKDAEAFIERSKKVADPKGFYFRKNSQDAEKYLALARSLVYNINRREVSAENAPQRDYQRGSG